MNPGRWMAHLAWLVIVAGTACATADDRTFLTRLNPFASAEPRGEARLGDEPSDGLFSSFSLWPTLPQREPGDPSLWDRMSRTTRNAYTKTKSVLLPWNKPAPAPQRSVTGSRPTPRKQPQPASRAWYNIGSWFMSDEPDHEIRTVNDFLALPRVEP